MGVQKLSVRNGGEQETVPFFFVLKFFKEPDDGPVKATVHKTGKLGFTKGACTLFKIGRKTETDGRDVLIMVPVIENMGLIEISSSIF